MELKYCNNEDTYGIGTIKVDLNAKCLYPIFGYLVEVFSVSLYLTLSESGSKLIDCNTNQKDIC